jgi:LPS export ABC transporter permease LptG/LPS export ABC transporter permease LptF
VFYIPVPKDTNRQKSSPQLRRRTLEETGPLVRKLTRYILGEITSHTLIGCALFTFILFIPNLPRILEVVVRNTSTLTNVLQVFLFSLPDLFKVTIPMAVLVGILLGFSRMAADSEIIAMRASGLGIGYFTRVAAMVAVAGMLFGLANTLYLAPRANQGILQMEHALATSEASSAIQPHVFYEDFRNWVLYVQDVIPGARAATWRKVFMADVSDPSNPVVTTATSATVVTESPQELLMRLRDGAQHEMISGRPDQYKITGFTTTELGLQLSAQGSVQLGRLETALYALPMSTLLQRIHGPDPTRYLIELNNRFSYPFACLVLMLVGVPLGVASRRGGKSSGFVFALLLVSLYYFLSEVGVAFGREGKLPVFLAVWSANLVFAAAGIFLLWQMATGGRVISALAGFNFRAPNFAQPAASAGHNADGAPAHRSGRSGLLRIRPLRTVTRGTYPRLLDAYVVREFLRVFFLILCTFVLLMLIFTFFDLMGHILSNHISLVVVGDYLLNLTPSMLYQLAPLAVLIAVLVTFGVLNRNSEIIAMKAAGISLYRLVVPIVSIGAVLAVSLFLFDQYYLPLANRRQEALRNIIKGNPAQTYLHPEQQWIFGDTGPGEAGQIFYYQFFDPANNEFANLSIFEFNPANFQLTQRIFAARVYWDPDSNAWHFQDGWVSTFKDSSVSGFRPFQQASFPEIHEQPEYFKREALQSQEMNFAQLQAYIRDLRQSGFDTIPLRVALWQKLAYPLTAIIMAGLAIPFALAMGRRGSLTAIAVAIAVALAYFVVNNLFSAMGNVDYLPASLAAWSADILFGLIGGYLLLRTPT